MGLITKLKKWFAARNTVKITKATAEVHGEASRVEQHTQVEPQELSESDQQLLQINQFIESDDLSNHELAAMFMQGLNVGLDDSMIQHIVCSANKMIFWASQELNEAFVQSIKILLVGPKFFGQYAEIAAFAQVLPFFTEIEELRWNAKHLWNQHPILIAAARLPKLKRLYAENCRMNFLPESLCTAPQLEGLFLAGNKLADMPTQLDQLHQLKVLDLSNNAFSNCPRSVCRLKLLEVLWLQQNPLIDINPRLLGRLYKLRDFRLPPSIANAYRDELVDWLPDVDFEKPYWQIKP